MNHPRFAVWLCSAAALVLLAVPAFAQQPDALPPEQAAPAAQVQPAASAYKIIPEMPLTPAGKADYRKLEEEVGEPLP